MLAMDMRGHLKDEEAAESGNLRRKPAAHPMSAEDVHLHEIPDRACKESDIPRERLRVFHILERPEEPKSPTVKP